MSGSPARTALPATRAALHAVADWVLAPLRHAHDGHIGLRVLPHGFGHDLARIEVGAAVELVVGDHRAPVLDLAQLARVAGVAPGQHSGTYEPETRWTGDEPLAIDTDAAHELVRWFTHGEQVLDALHASLRPDVERSACTLWPEHLDLAGTVGEESRRVNVGASPGDGAHDLPYLYVGPWAAVDPDEPFWNEPWGASLARPEGLDPVTALAFLQRGLVLAGAVS
jgi:hypothetical protein